MLHARRSAVDTGRHGGILQSGARTTSGGRREAGGYGVHAVPVSSHIVSFALEVSMRYLTILGSCLLTLTILGCSERPQPATPPAEESASSDESAPAADHATEAGKDPASRETNENDGGFNLGIDIGRVACTSKPKGPTRSRGWRSMSIRTGKSTSTSARSRQANPRVPRREKVDATAPNGRLGGWPRRDLSPGRVC